MKQKLNALIVDDEENALLLLNKLLEETLFFKNIKLAQSVAAANNELLCFEPDIIFLDIKMPGKDGFAFMQDLPSRYRKHRIVFVTAYDQFAIKALKKEAFDYLLKPVNRKELKQCITRFIEKRNEAPSNGNTASMVELTEKITRIKVNTRTGTLFINPVDILFCKAEGNYTTICTGKKHHLCSVNLGKVAELLPKNGFIRVGRSYIVNFEHITLLDRKESSVLLVKDSESVTVKIPKQHMKDLDVI
jgi:two-component system, LytTR family, response regulator